MVLNAELKWTVPLTSSYYMFWVRHRLELAPKILYQFPELYSFKNNAPRGNKGFILEDGEWILLAVLLVSLQQQTSAVQTVAEEAGGRTGRL